MAFLDNRYSPYLKALTTILLLFYIIIIGSVMYFTVFGDRFCDFVQFWTAGDLAQEGNLQPLYDVELFKSAMGEVMPCKSHITFRYPPVALLFFYPLPWLPYSLAFIVWTISGIGAFWIIIKKISPSPAITTFLMACPALLLNAMYGNNGVQNAALIGASLLLLRSKPLLAGMLASILIYKPHMAVLFPVFFLSGRHYKAFKTFLISSTVLIGISVLFWGIDPWQSFMGMLHNVSAGKYVKYVSQYTIISIPHAIYSGFGSKVFAFAIQLLISTGVVCGIIWFSFRKLLDDDSLAVLFIISILLFTPYCQVYDLALLNLALAWYLKILWEQGKALSPAICLFIGLLWLSPMLQIPVALFFLKHTGSPFPVAVPLLIGFYILIIKRFWYNDISHITKKE